MPASTSSLYAFLQSSSQPSLRFRWSAKWVGVKSSLSPKTWVSAVKSAARSKPTLSKQRVRDWLARPASAMILLVVAMMAVVLALALVQRNQMISDAPGVAAANTQSPAGPISAAVAVSPTQALASTAIATESPASPQPRAELASTQTPNGLFDLNLVTARYELSGRPTLRCGGFDGNDPVRKFTFTLAITNKTGADVGQSSWGAVAWTQKGRAFQLCYFEAEGPTVPDLPAGQSQRVTLSAFIERNQSITSILVGDNAGNLGRICIRGAQQVPCQ